MKRITLLLFTLSIIACNGNKKQADVEGNTLSPFIGYWENAIDNDSIQSLSVRIGERNDSLLVAFHWERKKESHIMNITNLFLN